MDVRLTICLAKKCGKKSFVVYRVVADRANAPFPRMTLLFSMNPPFILALFFGKRLKIASSWRLLSICATGRKKLWKEAISCTNPLQPFLRGKGALPKKDGRIEENGSGGMEVRRSLCLTFPENRVEDVAMQIKRKRREKLQRHPSRLLNKFNPCLICCSFSMSIADAVPAPASACWG